MNNAVLQNAVTEIVEHVKKQIMFNESTRTSVAGLVQEDQKHQDCIMEVVRVLMNHEQHILQNCAASQEIAQNINVLLQDNQSQSLCIASLMKEALAQAEVLREHHVGQHVLAEVIKQTLFQQQSQPTQGQAVTGNGPTVTDADGDDGDHLDFQGGQNPQAGPPDIGSLSFEIVPAKLPRRLRSAKQD